MKILDYKLYYFLGIGGIGMSALARYFKHYGKEVIGYDRTATPLTGSLEKEGIPCHFTEDVMFMEGMLARYRAEDIIVVYTPAVPKDNKELLAVMRGNYRLAKRSEVLGEITRSFKTIAIGGTHGKTTTTTLVTHLLKTAGINCFSFMGGISKNYDTNLLLGDAARDAYVVVEADEYDRSFLTLHPEIAVITSADADHLDIYGDASHVREGYTLFAKQVKESGVLIVKKTVDNDLTLTGKRLIYSLNLDTEYCARSISIENAQFFYDIQSPVESISRVTLGLPGLHNVENSVAAVAVAQQLGINAEMIREGLRSFSGVKRRFDYRIKTPGLVYIDDYAHHPEELRATIGSVKKLYPGSKITGIFQPHLFSRTRDFAEGFAESLSMLDECILLDIYPARELPIEGVDSRWLLSKVSAKDKKLVTREGLLREMEKGKREVILTMGAGDIDTLVEPIELILKNELEKNKL
jgi:UDP-N-acetylmuramate--alanine ligase